MADKTEYKKNKITRDSVPEGFTVSLALVDFLPVLFFGGTGVVLGMILNNVLVEVCAAAAFLSGLIKVLWKIIVAVHCRNIWAMFVQMRIVMPAAFTLLVAGVICSVAADSSGLSAAFTGMPQLAFFIAGAACLGLMMYFAFRLDSSDPKSNWLEQGINSVGQACIFAGVLIAYLSMR